MCPLPSVSPRAHGPAARVDNIRTALLNWLLVARQGKRFILRLDDAIRSDRRQVSHRAFATI